MCLSRHVYQFRLLIVVGVAINVLCSSSLFRRWNWSVLRRFFILNKMKKNFSPEYNELISGQTNYPAKIFVSFILQSVCFPERMVRLSFIYEFRLIFVWPDIAIILFVKCVQSIAIRKWKPVFVVKNAFSLFRPIAVTASVSNCIAAFKIAYIVPEIGFCILHFFNFGKQYTHIKRNL